MEVGIEGCTRGGTVIFSAGEILLNHLETSYYYIIVEFFVDQLTWEEGNNYIMLRTVMTHAVLHVE